MVETDLYEPIKRYLEAQAYEVKAEVRGCDVVAVRGEEPPVIVELKTAFTLSLVYQGLDRLALSDAVYLAVAAPKRRLPSEAKKLCRMLGLGLLTVTSRGLVEVHADPGPYQPRKHKQRRQMLLGEFSLRVGDPNRGGSTRRPLITAYRQDTLRCLKIVATHGPTKVAEIRKQAAVARAGGILLADVYGWFMREGRGVYGLSPKGRQALHDFSDALALL